MGLDMFALTITQVPETKVDFNIPPSAIELHYWRKHPDLHGWMEDLYRTKGGQRHDFNCTSVMLTTEDLDRLEQDIRHERLPNTIGSFFGTSNGTEQDDDLSFVAKARKAIEGGLTVLYTSWW